MRQGNPKVGFPESVGPLQPLRRAGSAIRREVGARRGLGEHAVDGLLREQ